MPVNPASGRKSQEFKVTNGYITKQGDSGTQKLLSSAKFFRLSLLFWPLSPEGHLHFSSRELLLFTTTKTLGRPPGAEEIAKDVPY